MLAVGYLKQTEGENHARPILAYGHGLSYTFHEFAAMSHGIRRQQLNNHPENNQAMYTVGHPPHEMSYVENSFQYQNKSPFLPSSHDRRLSAVQVVVPLTIYVDHVILLIVQVILFLYFPSLALTDVHA